MNLYEKSVKIDKEKRMWLHRNKHYGDIGWKVLGFDKNDFSDKNGCYISVGCCSGKLELESFQKIQKSENKKKMFEDIYYNEVSREKPRVRHFLYKFLFEFEKGDYIVIPSEFSSTFSVFQIESDVLDYNNNQVKRSIKIAGENIEKIISEKRDFKYFRKLKPIRINISRRDYARGALSSELKFQGTTKELSEEAKENLINAVEANRPISFYSIAMKSLTTELLKVIETITPEQFESMIEWYFKKIKADEVEILPKNYSNKKGKEDADIKATFENLKLQIYVQAKHYKGKADLKWANNQLKEYKEIKDMSFKDNRYSIIYWIICSAEEANTEVVDENIRVIRGEEFAEMLLKVGLQNIDEAL